MIDWESIDTDAQRAKVYGGWLVRIDSGVTKFALDGSIQDGWDWRPALTFVPDPNHEWNIEEPQQEEYDEKDPDAPHNQEWI